MPALGSWYLIVMLFNMSGSSAATATSFTVPMWSEIACSVAAKNYQERFRDITTTCINTGTGYVKEIK